MRWLHAPQPPPPIEVPEDESAPRRASTDPCAGGMPAAGSGVPVAGDGVGVSGVRVRHRPQARLKYNAGIHPKFRGLIIGLAQANHRFTTNMQRRVYGRATNIHIRPLNEEKAIQAAADLLGELFVFSVAGAAIIYEVQRSARSEARKEEVRSQEIEAIKKREEQLALEVQLMKQKISEMERQYSKWTLPGFRGLGTAQAAAQPAGTQQPTAA